MNPANAFIRSSAQRDLYGDGTRLATRTSALHRAKTEGRPVADVIADLATSHLRPMPGVLIADIGCGRGTTTRVLAKRFPSAALLAIDASAAMLIDARARLSQVAAATYVQADFHCLPLPDDTCDLVVAAFCLYHSPEPRRPIAEIARVLKPGGIAILVTKSANSYRELDRLVAEADLDMDAPNRPSLYATAHSGNLATLLPPSLRAVHLEHEQHTFVFADLGHVADYLATTPKYELPSGLTGNSEAISAQLRTRLTERPVRATSTVTFLLARRSETS
ncbi:class I SAM-dependent methyltransferase [Thermopolyspora sp. NPDC052614]|uniref:class I SAM-dependent methyltransferase n=1 Tax=Thermopolyspora sp. NPDC052614 TaxID=3155682 RepID=UPI00342A266E